MHHAACRIQRAWKVSRWRRKFFHFSERDIGWVGSLDWLQHHNLLYGTELADPEDVRWWMQQRTTAPLDREVDPWGCTQMVKHLNKMWYGRTTEEMQATQEERDVQRMETEQRERARRMESAGNGAYTYTTNGAHGQEVYVLYESGQQQFYTANNGQPLYKAHVPQHSGSAAAVTTQAAGLQHARGNQTDRSSGGGTGLRSLTVATATAALGSGATKAASLSPRRETSWLTGDSLGRSRGEALGASQAAAKNFASPLQTHRATRTTQPLGAAVSTTATMSGSAVVMGTTSSASAAALQQRPVSPMHASQRRRSTQAGGPALAVAGRYSLPGSARPQAAASNLASASTVTRHLTAGGLAPQTQASAGNPSVALINRAV